MSEGPLIEKEFISADRLVEDAFVLARRIYDSGCRPEVLLVLWRGGTPVGIVVHEFLLYKGIQTYHAAVKAESYTGIEQRICPRIEHMDTVMKDIAPGARVLVVDDIFDSGCTLKHVTERLRKRTSAIQTATLYYKEGANQTDMEPDFFLRKTGKWMVFPHELMDLTEEEIFRKAPQIHAVVTQKDAAPDSRLAEPHPL